MEWIRSIVESWSVWRETEKNIWISTLVFGSFHKLWMKFIYIVLSEQKYNEIYFYVNKWTNERKYLYIIASFWYDCEIEIHLYQMIAWNQLSSNWKKLGKYCLDTLWCKLRPNNLSYGEISLFIYFLCS